MFDICISVDANAKRHEAGDNKVGSMLLTEASGVLVRANLIIVGGGQATALVSTPVALPSVTTNVVDHRMLKLSFYLLFLYFH